MILYYFIINVQFVVIKCSSITITIGALSEDLSTAMSPDSSTSLRCFDTANLLTPNFSYVDLVNLNDLPEWSPLRNQRAVAVFIVFPSKQAAFGECIVCVGLLYVVERAIHFRGCCWCHAKAVCDVMEIGSALMGIRPK